jgi:hypothetical protein
VMRLPNPADPMQVNCVAPGPVASQMNSGILQPEVPPCELAHGVQMILRMGLVPSTVGRC